LENLLLIAFGFEFWELNCHWEKVLYRECHVGHFVSSQFCKGSIF
jgi:hypothetical protein